MVALVLMCRFARADGLVYCGCGCGFVLVAYCLLMLGFSFVCLVSWFGCAYGLVISALRLVSVWGILVFGFVVLIWMLQQWWVLCIVCWFG